MTIGDRIRQRRKAASMTQKELAEKTKISNQVISFYELNIRHPKIEAIERIAEALETSAAYLRSGEEEQMGSDDIRYYEGRLGAVVEALAATRRMNEALNGRANISRMIQEQIDILNDICDCLREDRTDEPGA